jgi:hypothetical protein
LRTGLDTTKNSETLMRWYTQFRVTRSFFVPKEAKKNLPPILELNPNATNAIKKYALENLRQLSCEMVSQFIHSQIIPNFAQERIERNARETRRGSELLPDNDDDETKAMLAEFGLNQICISTVYRWLKNLVSAMSQDEKGTTLTVMKRKLLLHTGTNSLILTFSISSEHQDGYKSAKTRQE